jgi:hypothetical protein
MEVVPPVSSGTPFMLPDSETDNPFNGWRDIFRGSACPSHQLPHRDARSIPLRSFNAQPLARRLGHYSSQAFPPCVYSGQRSSIPFPTSCFANYWQSPIHISAITWFHLTAEIDFLLGSPKLTVISKDRAPYVKANPDPRSPT